MIQKAIRVEDIEDLSYDQVDGFFDDEGFAPDGNTFVIPLTAIPDGQPYEEWGDAVYIETVEYEYDPAKDDFVTDVFEGKSWCGFASRNIAYVVVHD